MPVPFASETEGKCLYHPETTPDIFFQGLWSLAAGPCRGAKLGWKQLGEYWPGTLLQSRRVCSALCRPKGPMSGCQASWVARPRKGWNRRWAPHSRGASRGCREHALSVDSASRGVGRPTGWDLARAAKQLCPQGRWVPRGGSRVFWASLWQEIKRQTSSEPNIKISESLRSCPGYLFDNQLIPCLY